MADEISFEEGEGAQNSDEESGNYPKANFVKNCRRYFADFSDKTTIYGIKYLGDPNRSWIEKLYWLVVLCILFFISMVLITQTWYKWNESPIINFAQTPTPIWQIPFPAVTICSETKIKQTEYNFTNYFHKVVNIIEDSITDEEVKTFGDSALVCDNHLYQKGNKTTEHSVIDHLVNVAPRLEEMLLGCRINVQNTTCQKVFSPLLTDDGICFTFNMLDKRDFFTDNVYLYKDQVNHGEKSEGWTLENGYSRSTGTDTYPRRALTKGVRGAMFLLLRANKQDLDYLCRGPIQGFKVHLHHPAEMPRFETKFIQVPLNQSVVVTVKPDMVTTSPSLRSSDPNERKCFFSGEKPLKYFKTYTQENCHTECVANHTLEKCGCVPFYMPHENSTKICGSGSIRCMHDSQQDFLKEEVDSEIANYNGGEVIDSSTSCNCLPSCTSIIYNAEISHTEFHWPKVFESFKSHAPEGIILSRLTLRFKDQQFMATERRKLYSQVDFLASCGGLLALFIGFSIFSILEIVYFLSVRLYFNIRTFGKQFWSGSRNLSRKRVNRF